MRGKRSSGAAASPSGRVLGRWIALLVGAAAALGCATERPFVWVQDTTPAAREPDWIIQPRDTIVVTVRDQPSLSSGEAVVHDDGTYLQPMLGNFPGSGQTTVQLTGRLHDALKTLIVNPQITVSLVRVAPIRVNVIGEVKTPGSYELPRDRGVAAALAAAGWLTDFASKDHIFVVRSNEPGPRIRFRASELTTPDPRSVGFRLHDQDVVAVE